MSTNALANSFLLVLASAKSLSFDKKNNSINIQGGLVPQTNLPPLSSCTLGLFLSHCIGLIPLSLSPNTLTTVSLNSLANFSPLVEPLQYNVSIPVATSAVPALR